MPKKPKIQDYEGSVSVTDDITPTTREKIEQLNAEDWPNMTTGQLVEQRTILQNRIMQARMVGQSPIAQQLERGLAYIDSIINQRREQSDDDDMKLL